MAERPRSLPARLGFWRRSLWRLAINASSSLSTCSPLAKVSISPSPYWIKQLLDDTRKKERARLEDADASVAMASCADAYGNRFGPLSLPLFQHD